MKKGDVVFISVGRLEKVKNPEMLLRVFATLSSDNRLHLWFIGDGTLRVGLQAQIFASGLQKQVQMFGTRGDVNKLLSAADVFVLPSSYEGNPLSVMEAMAAGKPVIGTNVGGIPELVTDGREGLLVPSEDEPSLRAAMLTLISNPELREQMGRAGSQRAFQEFDSVTMTRRYERLYEKLIQTNVNESATRLSRGIDVDAFLNGLANRRRGSACPRQPPPYAAYHRPGDRRGGNAGGATGAAVESTRMGSIPCLNASTIWAS